MVFDNKKYQKKYRELHKEDNRVNCKKYREKNKEEISKQKKEYYAENKEKILQKNKQYRLENRKDISKQRKKYRNENKEKISNSMKQWNMENKEHRTCYNKQWGEKNKEHKREYMQEYYLIHPELVDKNLKRLSAYNNDHPDTAKFRQRTYRKTEKGKINMVKTKTKRKRKLGFNILVDNRIAESIHWHHINNDNVVAVPSDLHELYYRGKDIEGHCENMMIIVEQLYPELKKEKEGLGD